MDASPQVNSARGKLALVGRFTVLALVAALLAGCVGDEGSNPRSARGRGSTSSQQPDQGKQATIALAPDRGYIGSPFTVRGNGFAGGEPIKLTWDTSDALKDVKADGNGTFPAITLTVPTFACGQSTHFVVAVGQKSHRRAGQAFHPICP